ncbi:hypothetical protein BDP27DRAFT_1317508 [Rhodocollybia butyracea]|uniref:Uncharacterized protein n=1 Tax=Rhodocollybia butyracea TaxID=206335 RepID=A0A9P5UCK4_9AGAR|nr:hypothetical protein BDP27DRAFT_1317508 [Rhodocollybia butyracea]
MGWFTPSSPRRANSISDASFSSPHDESTMSESQTQGVLHPGFLWVRHPFQINNSTNNAYSTASPSLTSDTPLNPTSHLDMLSIASAPVNTAAQLPYDNQSKQHPAVRTTIPSRISHRRSHSWITRHRNLSLLIALPFPILLSVVYIVVGHAILHASKASTEPANLSSSAKIGAVGGAVLTLPALFLLYVIQRLCMEPLTTSGPDDFFDDESDAGAQVLWRGILGYVIVFVMILLIGVPAAPIGLSILRSLSSTTILSAAQGVEAGVVGGVIFMPIVVVFCVLYYRTLTL